MNKNVWKKAVLVTSIFCVFGAGQLLATESPSEPAEDESPATMINRYVSLHGVIELEASRVDGFEGGSESDIELATAELGLEARMSEWAQGTFVVEWDDDDETITVADAFVTIGNTEKFPMTFTGGRFTVPFGSYETNMISDPLTLEIGETGEDALMVGFEAADFHGSFYVFNGDTNEGGGDDTIEHFGATVGYTLENDELSLDVGIGYLSSLLDSDGLTDSMPDGMDSDYVGGIAAHLVAGVGDFVLIGEYVAGLDDAIEVNSVDILDGAGNVIGSTDETVNHGRPAAWNLEVGYTFDENDITVAFGVQGTKNLGGILPEIRLVSSVGFGLTEGLSLAIQYAHDEDYDVVDGGTGNSADGVTAQLAYEF